MDILQAIMKISNMLFDLVWNGFKYSVVWPAILALKPFMPW